MMKTLYILTLTCVCALMSCAQEIPNLETQFAQAEAAAPEAQRAEATIIGYNAKNEMVTLREGTNSLVCRSDDPQKEGFQSVCYHKDLQPFMTRGQELKAEGLKMGEIFDVREQEAKEGTLALPKQPTTLHLLEGKEGRYDVESRKVVDAKYRYVVYIPWATAETTGLPLKATVAGGPWLMDPGTHRAHIMISTPN